MVNYNLITMFISFGIFITLIFFFGRKKILLFVDQHTQTIVDKIDQLSFAKNEVIKKLKAEKDCLVNLDYELHKIDIETKKNIEIQSNELKERTSALLEKRKKEFELTIQKLEKEFHKSTHDHIIDLVIQKTKAQLEQKAMYDVDSFIECNLNKINKKSS